MKLQTLLMIVNSSVAAFAFRGTDLFPFLCLVTLVFLVIYVKNYLVA